MSTITKEQIEQYANAARLIQVSDFDKGKLITVAPDHMLELARIALASLEAEPVGEVSEQRDGLVMDGMVDLGGASTHRIIKGASKMKRLPLGTKFYTAPPEPASVPDEDLLHMAASAIEDLLSNKDRYCAGVWADIPAKLRRAAMLQGAEPVNQNDELPLDYLQGHKDGLEWSAQLAEANHPQTGDWLYDDPIELARAIRKGPDMPTAQDGNSPVTPDGWIPVSERMPNDKDFVWCWGYVSGWTESDGFEAYYDATRNKWWTIDDETVRKVTHWMPLPAAPLWE
ncbi:DUF551 domain-containing protein [Enterobacter roggenkampii]|uniref:DUF551 domain-containing protein n=1 Tax=Enterobacter roggenkampii TaxID=1812935 RepID=UPI001BE03D63|nr:DUF551 domain-containing protein [Enterobacter roggenkampii]WCF39333.1 DUF551 domain-containing protein [Enterobacter roggenkampii]